MKLRSLRIAALIVLCAAGGWPALGVQTPASANAVLKQVGFDQKLDAQVPLDLPFQDSTGRTVRLGDYFNGKPVVLNLVYYQCPMLCTEALNGLTRAIRPLRFTAGNQFNIVTVSFDPSEGPALASAKRKLYVERYGRKVGDKGWAFLTGQESSIRRLAASVGFRYRYDPELRQYAHATGLVVLTPTGRTSRYLYGLEYSARQLRLALLEASAGKIGSPVDKILLYCYCYDPLTGRYGVAIMRLMRLAALATLLGLGGMIAWFLRTERKHVAAS